MPDADVAVRQAEPADWPAIGLLLGRTADDLALLRRDIQRGYDPLLVFVAEESRPEGPGRLVGVIVGGVPRAAEAAIGAEDRPELRLFWVETAPGMRRRGTGTRLVEALLEEGRARQLSSVSLRVDGGQFEALGLFAKAGFRRHRQTLGLLLSPQAGGRLAGVPPPAQVRLRPLSLADVPLAVGLLIQLSVERAGEAWEDLSGNVNEGARGPHDDLPALSPAQLTDWLQREGTVGYGAWEAGDPQTPLGLAWASRRREDGVLRFIGVQDDARRRGIGRGLIGALVEALTFRGEAGGRPALRPLRAQLNDPDEERAFFRALGFEAERVTWQMGRPL
jgi:ribosomal protein S18 acetylase RimI-like enzyme